MIQPVDDGPELAKSPAHFRPFPRHGFQEQGGGQGRIQHGIQALGNQADAGFRPLPQVVPRVHVVVIPRHHFHFPEIIGDGLPGKGPHILFGGSRVQGIGGMGHQWNGPVCFPQGLEFFHVSGIRFPGFASPGIPGEESKGIRSDGKGRLPHGGKPFAGG